MVDTFKRDIENTEAKSWEDLKSAIKIPQIEWLENTTPLKQENLECHKKETFGKIETMKNTNIWKT